MLDYKNFEQITQLISSTMIPVMDKLNQLETNIAQLKENQIQMILQLDSLEGRMMVLNDKLNSDYVNNPRTFDIH